jgi:DNA-binding CsgD family transcriptional regulator
MSMTDTLPDASSNEWRQRDVISLLFSPPAALCKASLRSLATLEAEVHYWIAAGKSNQQIAEILGVALNTVGKHSSPLYTKLAVENRTAAAGIYHDAAAPRLNPPELQ